MAVDRTLQVLESRYAQTRVTTETGRQTVKTGNMIAAVFPHGTSREAEPQLHSHCVVMNATQLENGSWYSFSNDSAIMNKKLLGQVYQNELAVELKKIGYAVEQRAHGQFDIQGYSPELLKTFSTRRGQIEALMAQWKASGKTVRDAEGNRIQSDLLLREAANLQTRKAKPQIVEAGQLLQSWRAVLAMQGLSLPELPGEETGKQLDEQAVAEEGSAIANASSQVVRDAISHCGERDAIFKKTAIEKFAFEHHIGELSVAELESAIANHSELITVDEDKGKVTTQTALQLELETIRLMQQGKGQVSAIASDDAISLKFAGSSLSKEQRSAISTSCRSLDQVIGWQGAAGAGKTYALNALKEIAEAEGYAVSGYAPSAAAAHELGESLNIETNTVARLLLESAAAEPDPDADERRRRLWLIDEAGLLSMRDARSLLTKAADNDVRIVLVGDTRQLSAVEAGNPFRSLQAGGMVTAHLDQARRQQQAELRQAVQMISQGEISAGIQVLERSGAISEIEDAQARGEQLVSDYLSLSADERRATLLLSGTNANRLALTQQIRAGMQAEGSLGKNVYTMQSLQRNDLTQVQARYVSHYAVDDVIVPIRDYRQQGLKKHQQYRVSAIDTASNLLTVETSDRLIQIDPALCQRKAVYTTLAVEVAVGDRLKWTKNNRVASTRNGQQFTVESITDEGIAQIVNDQDESRTVDLATGAQHVDYAWVSTTYSSQGKTAGAVMALIDSATHREAFYVATSRAKQRLQLYTASVEALQQLAEQSRANENVSDYIPLFELTTPLETTYDEPAATEQITADHTTADHAGEATGTVDDSGDRGQSALDDGSRASAEADIGTGGVTAGYVEAVRRVVAGIEERLRTEERFQQVVRIGEAAQSIISGARQLALATAAADRLDGQLERKAQQRRLGSRDPVALVEATRLETPDSRQMPLPLVLQPPAPNASLTQQLDLFASTLGYQPGDRLYVRALLPKQLSDELAIEHGLKFEIEENGQKRLIPNTRRGYLTVGNWSFTHLRKNREPAVSC